MKIDAQALVSSSGFAMLSLDERGRLWSALASLTPQEALEGAPAARWRSLLGYSESAWHDAAPRWQALIGDGPAHRIEALADAASYCVEQARRGAAGGRAAAAARRQRRRSRGAALLTAPLRARGQDAGSETSLSSEWLPKADVPRPVRACGRDAGGDSEPSPPTPETTSEVAPLQRTLQRRYSGATPSPPTTTYSDNARGGVYSDIYIESLVLIDSIGKEWRPSRDQVAAWAAAYPGLDLSDQFRRMLAWLTANPTRRKTRRGLPRFVNSWLSRATPTVATPVRARAQDADGDPGSVWNLTPKKGSQG